MKSLIPTVLGDLAGSKKFIVSLLATLATIGAWRYGLVSQPGAEHMLLVIWPAYLLAQGVADHGKGAEQAAQDGTQSKNATALDAVMPFLEQMLQMYVAKSPEVTEMPVDPKAVPKPSVTPPDTSVPVKMRDCGHPRSISLAPPLPGQTLGAHSCPLPGGENINQCNCCDSCTAECRKKLAAAATAAKSSAS